MTTHGFVGDLLIRVGVVDAPGLTRAVAVQSQHANNLGRALADLGRITHAADHDDPSGPLE